MEPSRFTTSTFGRPARRPGDKWAFWYFDPAPIPRQLHLEPATVIALSDANLALGQLQGLGQLIADPQLLIGPYITREALASTRIEGTQASLAQVLRAAAEGDELAVQNDDIAEVEAYVRATHLGLERIRTLPLTQRLILEVHAELLAGVRGRERRPGELRQSPVWIGSPTDNPDTATFVPPCPERLGVLLADWERFVNETPTLPILINCALMHYQFETIHPFLDGNGRLGRLLIGLYLQQTGVLTSPLLYLSGYLEGNRREYYERLQSVREHGEIQLWLQFFLTAVRQQALDGIDRASRLVQARERYLDSATRTTSRVGELIGLMFANPFLTVRRVERSLEMTNQGARRLIRDAENRGWLRLLDLRGGRGRRQYWLAQEVFDIIEAAPLSERVRDTETGQTAMGH